LKNEDTVEIPKIKRVLRSIRLIVVIFSILLALVLILTNTQNINIDNFRRIFAKIDFGINSSGNGGDGYIYFSGSDSAFAPFKGGLAVCSTENVKVFDEKGNLFSNISSAKSKPVVISSPKHILSYDLNGKVLTVSNSFATLFEKSFTNNIYSADISQNGGFCVVTSEEGYKAKVTVFGNNYKEKYSVYSSEKYVIDAALSPDGKILALACVFPEGVVLNSVIDFYKIGEKSAFSQISLECGTVFDIHYKDNGSLLALGDKGATYINKKASSKAEISFEGRYLTSYEHSLENTVCILSQDMSRNANHVLIINDKGKVSLNCDTEYKIIDAAVCQNVIAIYTGDRLIFIDESGNDKIKIKKTIIINETYDKIFASKNNVFLIAGEYAKIENFS